MKKIWLCGASGMLASHFQRLLTSKKLPFIATSSKQLDITNLESVSDFVRAQQVTHILNCAAYTNVDQAEKEQKKAYLVNGVGPCNLGIAGKRNSARVLHFSTDYVFDGKSGKPYSEDQLCSPLGAYGLSKLAGEIKLLDEHPHACIIRTSWLFGYPGRNFVDTMLKMMNEKENLRVVYDQTGRPTYCQDLAEAALALLGEEGIFHFANRFETSWFQFANEIHSQAVELGFPLKLKSIEPITSHEYPTLALRPPYSTLSTKKIEGYLSQTPRPWQDALRDYLMGIKEFRGMG